MRAVYADTFYWVALTNPEDTRYHDAIALGRTLTDATMVTTDEVLVESRIDNRTPAFPETGNSVIEQNRESFLSGLSLYEAVPIRATAW